MKIKTIISEYFQWYDNVSEEDLPQSPIFDNSEDFIYVGEVTDGWTRWKPMEKDEEYDFIEIEEKLNIKIHDSVKEYYNSYWFCNLIVDYKELEIEMNPVVPGNYVRAFLSNLFGYASTHEGLLTHIPIGFDINSGFLVIVNNSNGKIQIEDNENSTLVDVADSLYILLKDGN